MSLGSLADLEGYLAPLADPLDLRALTEDYRVLKEDLPEWTADPLGCPDHWVDLPDLRGLKEGRPALRADHQVR